MDLRRNRYRLVALAALLAGAAQLGMAPRAQAQPADSISVSPALPTEGEDFTILAFASFFGTASPEPPSVAFGVITLPVGETFVSPQPPTPPQHLQWPIAGLPAGTYQINIADGDETLYTSYVTVRPRSGSLGLVGGRFVITVAAGQPGASPAAVQLADSGGYFSYFDPQDVEITVKAIDGRLVNGHYWIFVASMTNTAFAATVTDTSVAGCVAAGNCPTRTYTNPANTNQNFLDIDAF